MVATIADWSGVAGVAVGAIGLVLVFLQLRSGAAAARAQATIQFQRAFRESGPARNYLMKNFPVHEDLLRTLPDSDLTGKVRTWKTRDELSDEDRENADAVIRAMNDVAQYVADGLKLRSALQQYHTIFVRAGFLLGTYLDQKNARKGGRSQARWGRRMMDLFNAGIDYHRLSPKHKGRVLALERPATDGSGEIRLVLLDEEGRGIRKHPGFEDESGEYRYLDEIEVRRAVGEAERRIRR
jgi:hypothetical protein